ncbi:hypothetical protein D3C71_1606600 [compost metagenome]
MAGITGADEFIGHAQREHEARTGRVDVEGGATARTELGLDQARGGRENQVRRGGTHHDHVELRSVDTGRFKRTYRGVVAEVAGGLAFGRNVPFADTRARLNPLIAGVDHFLQILVGQHFFRQITTGARDPRVDPLAHCMSCSSIAKRDDREEWGKGRCPTGQRPLQINLLRRPSSTWS